MIEDQKWKGKNFLAGHEWNESERTIYFWLDRRGEGVGVYVHLSGPRGFEVRRGPFGMTQDSFSLRYPEDFDENAGPGDYHVAWATAVALGKGALATVAEDDFTIPAN